MTREEAIEIIQEKIQIDLRFCSDDDVSQMEAALRIAVAALQECEEYRWISVTERLPGEGGILATDGEQLYFTNGSWFYKSLSGKIRIPANYGAGADVTHWMPLPEPPKEGV